MSIIAVYITHANRNKAQDLIDILIKEKLIACANFLPIESSYWWKGNITNDQEVVSLVKTRKSLWDKLEAKVKELHDYEVPCIISWEIKASSDYENWVLENTQDQ